MFSKTIAITGSSGFIGKSLTDYFLDHEWYVRGIDIRDRTDQPSNRFALSRANMSITDQFQSVDLRRTDVMIHTAGLTDIHDKEFDDVISTYNPGLLQEAIAACHDNLIPLLINVSSSSVYGCNEYPFREDAAPKPISPYGMSKAKAEDVAEKVAKELGVKVFSIRLFNPIGKYVRRDSLVWSALTHGYNRTMVPLYGTTWRSYVHVLDFCRLCEYLSAKHSIWSPGHYVFNFGSTSPLSQTRLFAVLEKMTGMVIPYSYNQPRERDIPSTCPDMEHTKRFIGDFVSKETIFNGLKDTVKHFKALYEPGDS